MPEPPYIPKGVQPPPLNPTVAKSIAKPDAFSKAGSMGKESGKWSPGKGVRFRALKATRGPGRPRKHPRDKRDIRYY